MTVQEWLGADNRIGCDIWEKKYRHNDESFDEWLDRVSGGNSEVRRLIAQRKFLFGGRILANRGICGGDDGIKATYSNCYALPAPEDNLESIFDTAKALARTFSYGGGVGIDLSKLAPAGARVRNAAKEASGAVSFMELYAMVTGLISQHGRRGAMMLSLSCEHPDIAEFIDAKKDLSQITKANTSVRVTDRFMQAAVDDQPFELSFTRGETGQTISRTVNARELMMKLATNNWDMGEPGVLFWDRIVSWNLLSGYQDFEFAGVNPCAEEPLPAGGSCLLGSINLAEFVKEEDGAAVFDFEGLGTAVHICVKALNEVLDEGMPLHPLQIQRDSVADWRQIGLGIFGLADMLIRLGIRYGSPEAVELCDRIGGYMLREAYDATSNLGISFRKHDADSTADSQFARFHRLPRTATQCNSQLLTIAPTGTLSTMLGVSGGIEPIYANCYERKTESLHGKDVYYKVYTPIVAQYMEAHGITDEAELPDYFVTAETIDWHERIAMQAAWQRHVDASISSTINLPHEATPEDVFDIYIEAWRAGLKGITVFRDGCRRTGILSTDTSHAQAQAAPDNGSRGVVMEALDNVVGKKRKLITGCGSLHCLAFFDPHTGQLVEAFLNKGSNGGCQNFMIGLSRMISVAARAGVGVDAIVDQLESCGVCPSYAVRRATKHDTSSGSCCPVAVGRALKEMWAEMQNDLHGEVADVTPAETEDDDSPRCPECGKPLVFEGGCNVCKNCGWSQCW